MGDERVGYVINPSNSSCATLCVFFQCTTCKLLQLCNFRARETCNHATREWGQRHHMTIYNDTTKQKPASSSLCCRLLTPEPRWGLMRAEIFGLWVISLHREDPSRWRFNYSSVCWLLAVRDRLWGRTKVLPCLRFKLLNRAGKWLAQTAAHSPSHRTIKWV